MQDVANGASSCHVIDGQGRRLKLALLCDYRRDTAGTIIDHIFGIQKFSRHEVYVLQSFGNIPGGVDLDRFDGLIIHYSLIACHDSYIGPLLRTSIRSFRGLKLVFIQDDYRFINATVTALRDLDIHAVFGLTPQEVVDDVYSPHLLPGVIRETVLAGYVPEHLCEIEARPLVDRPIDIGYRARKLPAWIGSHSIQKWEIADKVLTDAPKFGLACDISTRESDRIYGSKWIKFVLNCKAMLGTESGSSVCDFTGQIQKRVEEHLSREPDAPFELLRDLYFPNEDGRLPIRVMSPRCFEAAALRTLMILYEGQYSGILQPWRHFVPLRRDHSNMDEVVELLRDQKEAQAIVDRAYLEVALNPANGFRAMVEQMDRVVDNRFRFEEMAARVPYDQRSFAVDRGKARFAEFREQARAYVVYHLINFARSIVEVLLKILPDPLATRLHETLRAIWWRKTRYRDPV